MLFPEREEGTDRLRVLHNFLLTTSFLSMGGAGAYCLKTYVHHEGGEVVLSFGQCTKEVNNVTFPVPQQLPPLICKEGDRKICVLGVAHALHTQHSPVRDISSRVQEETAGLKSSEYGRNGEGNNRNLNPWHL